MANVDSFSTSTMLNALQHIGFAAIPPRETKIEKDEQVEAMEIEEEEEEEDWIGDLMGVYTSKGLEAVLTIVIDDSKDQKPQPTTSPHRDISILTELDEEWTQELTCDDDHANASSNMQRMDQD